MIKVKIIDTKDLYLKDEENAINNGIQELLSSERGDGNWIIINKIVYRQNSTIIEYDEYTRSEDCNNSCERSEDCCEAYETTY